MLVFRLLLVTSHDFICILIAINRFAVSALRAYPIVSYSSCQMSGSLHRIDRFLALFKLDSAIDNVSVSLTTHTFLMVMIQYCTSSLTIRRQ